MNAGSQSRSPEEAISMLAVKTIRYRIYSYQDSNASWLEGCDSVILLVSRPGSRFQNGTIHRARRFCSHTTYALRAESLKHLSHKV